MVSPTPPTERTGNAVTARRWSRLLRRLGCRVTVAGEYRGQPCDLLVALHARRSAPSVARFRLDFPEAPLVVALTGTDLYRDLDRSPAARRSLEAADRLVVLQPLALERLPGAFWSKAVVIRQSVRMPWIRASDRARHFDVAVLAHLRRVKDPLRAAAAARRLPPESRIRVIHAGAVLEPEFRPRLAEELRTNPRFDWRGEVPRWMAKRILARSRLLVVSSRMEGGANVISEAAVAGIPILATRIPGNVGLLGSGYPGYFEVGDTAGLAALLHRAETDAAFHDALRDEVRSVASHFHPSRERAAWKRLLEELHS